MQYDAFGVEISPDEDDTNPFCYAGQYYDTETGTYYLRARYYDPAIGRFTQQDSWQYANPQDPLSLNLYVYCLNNPLLFVDMTGHFPSLKQILTAAAIIAVAAVTVVAIVASAGAVGVAAGVTVASIGATSAVASTVSTIATVGTYVVAGGVGAVALSNAGEVMTGTNIIRDELLNGNETAYETIELTLAVAGTAAIYIGSTTNNGISKNMSKPKADAKEMHKIPNVSTPCTSIDKLYPNKPGEFQRQYYDYLGNRSARIDFTEHAPGTHKNPHVHWR